MSIARTADALREALDKLEEAEDILWEGAYEGTTMDRIADLKRHLEHRLGEIERKMLAEFTTTTTTVP